jgi:hypothetical protein
MMIDTMQYSAARKEQIQALIKKFEGSERLSELVKTLNALVTAIDYDDSVLIESSLDGIFEAIARTVEKCIADFAGTAEKIRPLLPAFWNMIEDYPPEGFQEIGHTIASQFDNQLKMGEELRDKIIKILRDHEYKVGNAAALDQEIRELRTLKAEMLKDWPWEDRPLPAVDRAMVTRSRDAIACGEKGLRVEDLIREARDDSDK